MRRPGAFVCQFWVAIATQTDERSWTSAPRRARETTRTWGRTMPRREDLKSVLVIGSGPIVIGQGCEFDYSGTQACRVLKARGHPGQPGQLQPGDDHDRSRVRRRDLRRADHHRDAGEGHRDPASRRGAAHARRPDRAERGRRPARLGHPAPVQRRADRRQHRRDPGRRGPRAVQGDRHRPGRGGPEQPHLPRPGRMPRGRTGSRTRTRGLGYPVVVRPSFTLGGLGSGIARTRTDLRRIAGAGLDASPTHEVLLEESILGWKEFELELMRDSRRQRGRRLLDREHRPDGRAHRRLGHRRPGDDAHRPRVPADARHRDRHHARGRRGYRRLQHPVRRRAAHRPHGRDRDEPARVAVVARSPPRPPASRSPRSPRGWPSATRSTRSRTTSPARLPACFEPALDYVVVKVPRFAFEKFPGADPALTTHMKSVGEAMAIGRNFPEALQKALRSLESNHGSFGWKNPPADAASLLRAAAAPRTTGGWPPSTRRCAPAPAWPTWSRSPASIPGSSTRSSRSRSRRSRSAARRP